MGTTVLDAGKAPTGVHLYAHCLPGREGGVTVLAINLDRAASHSLSLPASSERYTLSSAAGLRSMTVELNGAVMKLNGDEEKMPRWKGVKAAAGEVKLAPASITFLAIPEAGNAGCAAQK